VQSVFAQLLAQRATVNAEHFGGTALIAVNVTEYSAEQRLFHFAQYEVVQFARLMAVQVGEVRVERVSGLIAQCDGIAVRMMYVVSVMTIVPIMMLMGVSIARCIDTVQRFYRLTRRPDLLFRRFAGIHCFLWCHAHLTKQLQIKCSVRGNAYAASASASK